MKTSDFELGLLVVIRWRCRRVFYEVPVICLNTVIVETGFKILEIFPLDRVELWQLGIRHACVYHSPVMKVIGLELSSCLPYRGSLFEIPLFTASSAVRSGRNKEQRRSKQLNTFLLQIMRRQSDRESLRPSYQHI